MSDTIVSDPKTSVVPAPPVLTQMPALPAATGRKNTEVPA
jgi:hypothetical protein